MSAVSQGPASGRRHLVLCGAGHAHLDTLAAIPRFILQGHAVTVVSPDSYHYYSGMGPGMLAGVYPPRAIRFNVRKMTEDAGARFVEGKVRKVDPHRRLITLENDGVLEYDVASFNVGSEISGPGVEFASCFVFAIKPIRNLETVRRSICQLTDSRAAHAVRLAVLGGGAAGVEAAGNAWRAIRDMGGEPRVTLIARGRALRRFSQSVRRKALSSMAARGIEVLEDRVVRSMREGIISMVDGKQIPFDLAILATGTKPPDFFARSGIPTGDDGGMLVNESLQSVEHPELFGGGDCITFRQHPLDRVGVYAVRENPIVAHNLEAALNGGPMEMFRPQKSYLQLLNMGDGTAISNRGASISATRYAFRLKDRIDREFMLKYQRSGELEESAEEIPRTGQGPWTAIGKSDVT